MKLFLLRMLPWVTAVFAIMTASWQWAHPVDYPLPLFLFLIWFVSAATLIAWRRLPWEDALEKLMPPLLMLIAVSMAFLIAEQAWERVAFSALLAGVSFFTLELFFLMVMAPPRYPVNGLSRFNVALVPVAGFFFTATLNGLWIFLHVSFLWSVAACMLFGAACLAFTSHPTATQNHRLRWASLGALIGFHIGLLTIFLPVSMAVHGALAAFLLTFPLRIRRYGYLPMPGRRLAFFEVVLASWLFLVMVSTSKWI